MVDSNLPQTESAPARRLDMPALSAEHRGAVLVSPDGSREPLTPAAAVRRISDGLVPVVCHASATARRLNTAPFPALDLLELYAFVRPAKFCRPTPSGLADALELDPPEGLENEAQLLQLAGGVLLTDLIRMEPGRDRDLATETARIMEAGKWGWSPLVLRALAAEVPPAFDGLANRALEVWRRLPEWSEFAPEVQPSNIPVTSDEARTRLSDLVGDDAEDRPQQGDYASAVSQAFAPRDEEGAPNAVLAEAGTGVGKTLGYIAPASLWAERNDGTVWISTYTRNLQRQIDYELNRLHPDPVTKNRKVVIRKGRENYLCLLNYEDAVTGLTSRPQDAVGLGLMARWITATRDGDIGGGDFPAWLVDLAGARNTIGMADRRGECIYSACAHYHKCFVEKTVRRAKRADIVVANHALVLAQTATGGMDDGQIPTRLVFDEGHHLFDAADSAFSAQLSGQEGAELRRWLLGPEEGRKTRSRGLQRRIKDVALLDERIGEFVDAIVDAAHILPGSGWNQRIAGGTPRGDAENFLAELRQQVYARAKDARSPYDLETETDSPVPGLLDAAENLRQSLNRLIQPMRTLSERLMVVLDENTSDLDTALRNRIDSVSRGLRRRAEGELEAWRSMLAALADGTPEEFVDWFSVTRSQGRDIDIGMHRHWIDPMLPFAKAVAEPSHGIVVTSATLRDGTGDAEVDWMSAEERTGAIHLEEPPYRAQVSSPFDYPEQTRVLVVTDVRKDDLTQVAAAYRELFLASGGGALGLFTAITRLRAVHENIAPLMEDAGYPLLAQHVDRMDTGSLVEIFRAEERSCLLGTDAVRDGVDVPGRSLRLIVFDRVPWPRPSILHRARRKAFTRSKYDDLITRLRLKQAYGRLVRRVTDCGVFVMMDPMMPSRLAGAFPDGVEIHRVGLADAVATTRDFLSQPE
ncbi:MAG: ATP-dependent DNA helicase [Rhodospirillaceae bacterium]|nr:MAG: ATP-dependent DNA helicase [Rhodospirillaceae bacterium]